MTIKIKIMKLKRLEGTCSMYELHGVSSLDISAYSKEQFKDWVEYNTGKNWHISIIYNTNFSWISDFFDRMLLWTLGFRQIGSYSGYLDKKVYILLKKY